MLRIASRALDAQRYGLDVTGQNIANVNTAGYTRRSVVYEEVPPLDPWSPGGGVDFFHRRVECMYGKRITIQRCDMQPRHLGDATTQRRNSRQSECDLLHTHAALAGRRSRMSCRRA